MLIRFIFVDDGAIHLHSQFPIFGPKNINLFNCLLIIVSSFLLQSALEVKVQSQSTRRLAFSRSSDNLSFCPGQSITLLGLQASLITCPNFLQGH